jgi:hypothetical protein
LIVDATGSNDDPSVVGDEAHTIARSESFTRGDYDSLSPEERDHYSNLILLCKTHHKQIDDQPTHFTVERLREIKAAHELEVRSNLTAPEEKQQKDAIIYSGYIDEWRERADLDNRRNHCAHVNGDTPALPKTWYDAQKDFLIWIIGRIWPKRYPLLGNATLNYKAVLQDFLNVFDRHAELEQDNDAYTY